MKAFALRQWHMMTLLASRGPQAGCTTLCFPVPHNTGWVPRSFAKQRAGFIMTSITHVIAARMNCAAPLGLAIFRQATHTSRCGLTSFAPDGAGFIPRECFAFVIAFVI